MPLLSESKSKPLKNDIFHNRYLSLLQLNDLINFLAVAFFVVVGVGIYYHANLWPDDQLMWNGDWTDWRIWTIVFYPYWQLYAEMNLGILQGIKKTFHLKNNTVYFMLALLSNQWFPYYFVHLINTI